MATAPARLNITVWDAATGVVVRVLEPGANIVAWSPVGGMLAGRAYGKVRVWQAHTGTLEHTLLVPGDIICGMAWRFDGRHLATGSIDGTVRVWEATVGSVRVICQLLGQCVRSVAWSPCRSLLLASTKNAVHVFSVSQGQLDTQPAPV